MAQTKIMHPPDVVEQNIALTGKIMRYLMMHEDVFHTLPDQFELIILPEDNPEMRLYNLELLDRYCLEEKPIVFARIKMYDEKPIEEQHFNVFVPVAA